ncbi:ABC transporter permease [soil metagenome]
MKVLGRKLLQLAVVFVVVTFFTVFLMSLVPGKPENVVIPFDASPGQQLTKDFRKDNNLDRALPVRWGKWAGKFLTGDLGDKYSSSSKIPVSKGVKEGAPVSILLISYTQIFALLIAIPLAVLAAYRSGRWIDKFLNTVMFGLISLPNFAVALTLSYLLGVKLGWVPTQGYTGPTENLVLHFKSMVVPVLALSCGQIAVYMRLLRSDLVATLQEDFILMAKSKGISNGRVLWRHALRPSSLTLLTVAGLNVGTLIGGTLVVEYLLGIPGLGIQVGEAIFARQYVQLQSLVAVIAISFVLINFLIDYLYTVLDPRIRERSA